MSANCTQSLDGPASDLEQTGLRDIRDVLALSREEDHDALMQLKARPALLSNKLLDHLTDQTVPSTVIPLILEILFLALYSHIPITSSFVKSWFQLVKSTGSFSLRKDPDQKNARETKALSLMISLEILSLMRSIPLTDTTKQSEVFVSDPGTLILLHDFVLENSAKKSGALLSMTWGVYLHHLLLEISESNAPAAEYQTFVDHVFSGDTAEPHRYLIESAVGFNFYEQLSTLLDALPDEHQTNHRLLLFDVFREAQSYIQYSLATTEIFSLIITTRSLAMIAWEDTAVRRILDISRQQFPHHYRPLLLMLQGLAYCGTRTAEYLEVFVTFTQTLPIGFLGYSFTEAENDRTLIQLTEPLALFLDLSSSSEIRLPSGTQGLLSNQNSQSLVLWHHQYSPLQYLAAVLHASSRQLSRIRQRTLEQGILTLFGRILEHHDNAESLLDYMNQDLDQDLLTSVTNLAEQIIEGHIDDSTLLVQCIALCTSIMRTAPSLAWPHIARLPFFDRSGLNARFNMYILSKSSGGSLSTVIAITNLVACIIESVPASLLSEDESLSKSKSTFLLLAVQSLADVFQAYMYWPADQPEKSLLGASVASLFESVLSMHQATQLVKVTKLAASMVAPSSAFLLSEIGMTNSLKSPYYLNVRIVLDHIGSQRGTQDRHHSAYVHATLSFYAALIRSRRNDGRLLPIHSLLFQHLKAMIVSISQMSFYRRSTLRMLISITHDPADQLPSILAYLGTEKVKLRECINNLFNNVKHIPGDELSLVWRWLNNMVQSSQEGVALYLWQDSAADSFGPNLRTILQTYFSNLEANMSASELTFNVLTTVVSLSRWPMLLQDLLQSSEFLGTLQLLLRRCSVDIDNQTDEVVTVAHSYNLSCAGLIYRLFATALTTDGAESKEGLLLTMEGELLNHISLDDLSIRCYRASLHGNLARNIAQRFHGFSLNLLVRTNWDIRTYGDSFYYDLSLARSMIKPDAFLREIRIANFNLSLMDAQVARIRGLDVFLNAVVLHELSSEAQWSSLYVLTNHMLKADVEDALPGIKGLQSSRAETVHALVEALTKSKMCQKRDQDCLTLLSNLVNSFARDFSASYTAQDEEIFTMMTQSLIRLLVTMRTISISKTAVSSLQRSLLTIFSCIVSIAGPNVLRKLRSTSQSSDLLDNITILGREVCAISEQYQFPKTLYTLELLQSRLLSTTMDVAAEVKLTYDGATDTSRAESTFQFLLMLLESTNGTEQLPEAGVFRFLSDSAICSKIRYQGVSSTTNPELYSVWVQGILPLILKLTVDLGKKIISNISILLEAYSEQFARTYESWSQPVRITQDGADELLLCAILFQTTGGLHESEIIEVNWKTSILERLEVILAHPKSTTAMIEPSTSAVAKSIFQTLEQARAVLS